MKIYEITNELKNEENFIDLETGEIDTAKIEALNLELDEKIDNLSCWVKNLNAEAKAIRDEEITLADRRKTLERRADGLTSFLSQTMLFVGKTKFESPKNKISFRTSKSIEIEDEAQFLRWAEENADDLLTYKDPTPNKTAIKKAIEGGAIVPHSAVVEKMNIQIK